MCQEQATIKKYSEFKGQHELNKLVNHQLDQFLLGVTKIHLASKMVVQQVTSSQILLMVICSQFAPSISPQTDYSASVTSLDSVFLIHWRDSDSMDSRTV